MPASLKYRLLAGLLRELQEREGYLMATDKLLQVQELLERLPEDIPVKQLSSLLAPLFATEPRQQARFYELFDQCLLEARTVFAEEKAPLSEDETPDQIKAQKGETRWRRILLLFPPVLALMAGFNWNSGVARWYTDPVFLFGVAVLLGGIFAAWKLLSENRERVAFLLLCIAIGIAGNWLRPQVVPPPRLPGTRMLPFNVPVGDTLPQSLLQGSDTAKLIYSEPREVVETALGGRFRVDSSGIGTYIASAEAVVGQVDTLTAFLTFARGTDTIYWIANIIAPPEAPPPPDTSLIEELPLPFPRDIAELKIDNNADQRFKFYQEHEWELKGLLLLLLGMLAWAIARWDRYRRAKVVAELQRPNRPPYVWQPETGQDAASLLAPGLELLLTRLRSRATDSRRILDVPATIRATSRRAGRINFIYRRRTLPPDFLLLIDRLAVNDHRARLYDSLYQVFLRAEAPVARYFYDGDPRLLFDKANPQGLPLGELLHQHDGAQLIIVGEGQGLLSPMTGRPAPWTNLLATWPRRVLLSPRPLKAWGLRERQLRDLLPILPATPGGLSASIDLFNSEDPNDTRSLLPKVKDALQKPFAFQHDLIEDLQEHYEPEIVDWIAACALWPTLHWDLTVHLGRAIGEREGQELITFENLRDLTRLPWFAEGHIPDPARRLLLDHLAARGLEAPLRQSLRELLQQAPAPPEDSAAYDDYRMNLILNELFLKPDAAQRRQLEREFARYLAAGKKADFVALRLLDRPPNQLDVLLGGALKKFAFREGLPGLGWKLVPKLLGIWAVLAIALLAFRPNFNPCDGDRITYGDLELCINNDDDRLLYLQYLARDAILAQDTQMVDSLRAEADAIRLQDTAFYRNTAIRYYNFAARSWNCTRQSDMACDTTLAKDSLQQIACDNFRRGSAVFTAFAGGIGIQYFTAMQKVCPKPEPPPQFFRLAGRLLSELDGRPVAGAVVRVGEANSVTIVQLTNGSGDTYSAISGSNGRFSFDSLSVMTEVRIYIEAPNFQRRLTRSQSLDELPDIWLQPTDEAREAAAWAKVQATGSAEDYAAYLAEFPDGPNADVARTALNTITDMDERFDWENTQKVNTVAAYQTFLQEHPDGTYATLARQEINRLQDEAAWQQAQAAGTPEACQKYLTDFPEGQYVTEAQQCATPVQQKSNELPAPIQKLINDMVRVEGGTFMMGCLDEKRDGECEDDEKPPHEVMVSDFSIGRYEITQEEWRAVMGSDPPELYNEGCDQCPVEGVSWDDIQEFLQKLNQLTGQRFRLPSEAEWEYAARGGARSQSFLFSGSNDIDEVAWYNDNSQAGNTRGEQKTTRPVGGKTANELGLFDMSGNVWEWVEDDYHETYQGAPVDGKAWLSSPERSGIRLFRGGSHPDLPGSCRLSSRLGFSSTHTNHDVGFRIAL